MLTVNKESIEVVNYIILCYIILSYILSYYIIIYLSP